MAELSKKEQHLSWICRGLDAGSSDGMFSILTKIGLDGLKDPELLSLACMKRVIPAVVLLASLRRDNEFEPAHASMVLAAYGVLTSKQLNAEIRALGANSALYQVIATLIAEDRSNLQNIRKSKIGPDWLLAFNLTIDFCRTDLTLQMIRAFLSTKPKSNELFDLAESMLKRQAFFPDHIDFPSIIRSFKLIRNACQMYADKSTIEKINYKLAETYIQAGLYDDALHMLDSLSESFVGRHARFSAAQASIRAGKYTEACTWFSRFLEREFERDEAALDDIKNMQVFSSEPPKIKTNFPNEAAGAALKDLYDVLAPLGIKPFLMSGTLLGYARHRGFLSHDKDVDVGLVGWEDQFAIFQHLLLDGKFVPNSKSLRGENAFYMPVKHFKTGIPIDIFLFHERGDKYQTGINFGLDYTLTFQYSRFDLAEAEFCGTKVYVPNDIDRNLTENFGPNWRIPDTTYESLLEAPSIDIRGEPVFMLVLWDKLLFGYVNKRPAKVRRVVQIAANYADNPLVPSPELLLRALQWCDRIEARPESLQPLPVPEIA
jgi:tetratricopeptide (TPR) repeat protein